MKKTSALALALALSLGLFAGCGDNTDGKNVGVMIRQNISEEEFTQLGLDNDETFKAENIKTAYVDTLNDALMMLKSGKADHFATNRATAEYIVANDTSLKIEELPKIDKDITSTLHILTLSENTEMNQKINTAIGEMKADGTLDKLYADYVTACINGCEHEAIEMPKYDGADTLKVGVSGDIPPIDFVDESGTPIGYNMFFLSALAEKLQINIDIQIIDSGSRFAALSSEKIDAFFWHMSFGIELGDQTVYALSESYAELDAVRVCTN